MENDFEINLWSESCPHCGKTHEWHYHREGRTYCEDGIIVCANYPYNIVTKKDMERLLANKITVKIRRKR